MEELLPWSHLTVLGHPNSTESCRLQPAALKRQKLYRLQDMLHIRPNCHWMTSYLSSMSFDPQHSSATVLDYLPAAAPSEEPMCTRVSVAFRLLACRSASYFIAPR